MRKSTFVAVAAIVALSHDTGSAQAQEKISRRVVKIRVMGHVQHLRGHHRGGRVTAAKMAVEDFGGKVLGKPVEVIFADHQNKADIASSLAREWFDTEHVDALLDVAASATALAAMEVAKTKNKIIVLNGPAAARITGEACGPPPCIGPTTPTRCRTAPGRPRSSGLRYLVFHHRRLRVRPRSREGHRRRRESERRHGDRLGPRPDQHAGFLLVPPAGAGSKAKVIGLANAGADTINSIKQAAEFGIVRGGQRVAGLLVFINDVNSLGLEVAQGMVVTEAFYWDLNEETRAWSRRFFERHKKMPNMVQAGLYSTTMHYLKAVEAAGTDETGAVMEKMRSLPVNDFFAKDGRIREDGRMVHGTYLFEVKKPSEFEANGITIGCSPQSRPSSRSCRWPSRNARWCKGHNRPSPERARGMTGAWP